MRLSTSRSGHLRSGAPPRHPSEATSPSMSNAQLPTVRRGSGLNSSGHIQFAPQTSRRSSTSASYDGRTAAGATGMTDGENPNTSLNGTGMAPKPGLKDATLPQNSGSALTPMMRHSGSGLRRPQEPQPLRSSLSAGNFNSNHNQNNGSSREGGMPNGALMGSLAGYLPTSAVAMARAAAANNGGTVGGGPFPSTSPPPPQQQQVTASGASSPLHGARYPVPTPTKLSPQPSMSMDPATGQDLRSSRQSITVLGVSRDGGRPMSGDVNGGGGFFDTIGRQSSANNNSSSRRNSQVGSYRGVPQSSEGMIQQRVQREAMAPIAVSEVAQESLKGRMTVKEQQQQREEEEKMPVAPPRRGTAIATPNAHRHASSEVNNITQQQGAPSSGYVSPSRQQQYQNQLHHHPSTPQETALVPGNNRGVVVHHRPSPAAAAARQLQVTTGPATMQLSTTTLTKTCKKVRYLLPDEAFNPDVPDPTDDGGLDAAEEAAILDPVQYTKAATEVAGRYPMLLRRPSAQGGDLLRARRGSAGESGSENGGAPRPTFLLDDGNRWARETNRSPVATTQDPSGINGGQLPSPSILRKSSAERTAISPFPALQQEVSQTAVAGLRGGYLLQRHVQQSATGKELVSGTIFEPPTGSHRQRQRQQQLNADAPTEEGGTAVAATRRRSGTDGLYEEILRRTQQNRRGSLPSKMAIDAPGPAPPPLQLRPAALAAEIPTTPSSANNSSAQDSVDRPQPPPLPPHPNRLSAGARPPMPPPATNRPRRARPHPSSAEPTPLHARTGVNGGRLPHTPPEPHTGPPRSSSQPYIVPVYLQQHPHYQPLYGGNTNVGAGGEEMGTSMATEMSSGSFELPPRAPLPPPATQASPGTYTPYSPSQQQQRPIVPPSVQTSLQRMQPPSDPPCLDSPPPRPHPPSANNNSTSVNTTIVSSASPPSMSGYTSGRFSKYNPPGSVAAPPPPPPPPQAAAVPRNDIMIQPARSEVSTAAPQRTPPPPQQATAVSTGVSNPSSQPPQQQQQQQQYPKEALHVTPSSQQAVTESPMRRRAPGQEGPQRDDSRNRLDVYRPVPQQGPPILPPQSLPEPQRQQKKAMRTRAMLKSNPTPPPPAARTQHRPREAPPSDDADADEDDGATYPHGSAPATTTAAPPLSVQRSGSGSGRLYDASDAEETEATMQQHEEAYREEDTASDDPATDTAVRHRPPPPRHHHPVRQQNQQLRVSPPPSAGAEVRRSLLQQYPTAEEETPHDTPLLSSKPRSQHPALQHNQRKGQALMPSSEEEEGVVKPSTRRQVPARAPPPPPRAAAASSSVRSDSRDSYHRSNTPEQRRHCAVPDDHDPADHSVSSYDTETQPVTVSERDMDEIKAEEEAENLGKKQPPLLVLGGEVYAPEGYEEGPYEEEEDGVEGDMGDEEEEAYYYEEGEEMEEGEYEAYEHVNGAAGDAQAVQNSSLRYDEYEQEL